MLKIKRFFMNEFVASMLMLIIMFIIAFGILFMMAKSDKKDANKMAENIFGNGLMEVNAI